MGWEQLTQMQREARADRERHEREGPLSCPICGSGLDENAQGHRNCPLGHYTWRGGPPPQVGG